MSHAARLKNKLFVLFGVGIGFIGLASDPQGMAQEVCRQSARSLPVVADVDVAIVGGSTGAVAAALSAAKEGAKVFLVAPQPYLGDDMTATLRLWYIRIFGLRSKTLARHILCLSPAESV
jgi:hypothetical protein